ncbi:hypothetical protein MesoLj131b_73590 (plasmid) [Mesorhizobium sp. 131-2-5]|nr:hypothetical protein MesoLj131b_73590 [Mesorhizobium sp. 131-2-5]
MARFRPAQGASVTNRPTVPHALQLSQRNAIAMLPTGGWWRENPGKGRADTEIRYSLAAKLRTAEYVDLYAPIATPVAVPAARG